MDGWEAGSGPGLVGWVGIERWRLVGGGGRKAWPWETGISTGFGPEQSYLLLKWHQISRLTHLRRMMDRITLESLGKKKIL